MLRPRVKRGAATVKAQNSQDFSRLFLVFTWVEGYHLPSIEVIRLNPPRRSPLLTVVLVVVLIFGLQPVGTVGGANGSTTVPKNA